MSESGTEMSRVLPDRLSTATARSPLASGRASTSKVALAESTAPWRPIGSWSSAIRSLLPRAASPAGVSFETSEDRMNGAAIIAHRPTWLRLSASVSPGAPAMRKSGSFQLPGPAYRPSQRL